MTIAKDGLSRAVRLVAILNLVFFGFEFVVALSIRSVSLLADSIDFLEDAAVNFLIFAALGWTASQRAKVGMALSAILLLPAVALVWTLWRKFAAPVPPDAFTLSATGAGALAINMFCAFTLARWRHHGGSLTNAAFLSARNDAIANVGIIMAGAVTLTWPSVWPDVIVGVAIAAMNVDAARAVWAAAQKEHTAAQPRP